MDLSLEAVKFSHPPFIFHKGMWAERSAKADCSKERMFTLAKGKSFLRMDRAILLALGRYGYLNVFLLRRYLCAGGFRNADQKLVKERLSFLMKNGLVFRYEFFHRDPYTLATEGSPFIYSLSGGGWMFLKVSYRMHVASSGLRKFYEFPDLKDQTRLSQILGMLTENQFAILFEDQYASRVDMAVDMNGKCFKSCGQRMEYKIRLADGHRMGIYPVGVRCCGEWEQDFLNRLSAIRAYAQGAGEASCSVLAICESSEHAVVCETRKLSDPALSGLDVFYGLDHTIAGSPDVFGRMIEIHKNEAGAPTRSYFRLDICGNEQQGKEETNGDHEITD